jgi:hypothetical protein
VSHQAIQRFIDRVRLEARRNSKSMSVSLDDAQDIGNDLALLLLRENELLREISELKSAGQITQVIIGGGTFK